MPSCLLEFDYANTVTITITDRVEWHERCRWIEDNATYARDMTQWSNDDIHYVVDRETAVLYYLTWGS